MDTCTRTLLPDNDKEKRMTDSKDHRDGQTLMVAMHCKSLCPTLIAIIQKQSIEIPSPALNDEDAVYWRRRVLLLYYVE